MVAVTEVRAAGGVVWRADDTGTIEVCLVHRPRHDDWSLPKGKLEPAEHPLAAAVREVAEETGVRAVPQVRLPSIRYTMPDGHPKLVDYWSMRAVRASSGPVPDEAADEVDEVCWLPLRQAQRQLTYRHDVGVLRGFAALPPVSVTLTLVRHGHAGSRDTWPGPDSARPLDTAGLRQAQALAALLALTGPDRVLSASPRRCVQTMAPLAQAVDLSVEVNSVFDEPAPGQDPDEKALAAAGRLTELAAAGTSAAVCSQGKVIAPALMLLSRRASADYLTAKGGGWLLSFAGDRLVGADQL
ncbi:NUDIX domain-containing protein [Micromonospora sp. NBC_01813]|uniref:NUDIX domain-containing protein n=1 Tax=Micromonospora sp. NBC_01813 TaxID=2975988 RepID=UPI002DD9FDB0|nr:NUDIX domain-containing protein [Micromonospora sp. NBC_01813]WSA11838.1 NUDIX hydrolase [Micromonospora sp. NBC_01813]